MISFYFKRKEFLQVFYSKAIYTWLGLIIALVLVACSGAMKGF